MRMRKPILWIQPLSSYKRSPYILIEIASYYRRRNSNKREKREERTVYQKEKTNNESWWSLDGLDGNWFAPLLFPVLLLQFVHLLLDMELSQLDLLDSQAIPSSQASQSGQAQATQEISKNTRQAKSTRSGKQRIGPIRTRGRGWGRPRVENATDKVPQQNEDLFPYHPYAQNVSSSW